MQKIFWLKTPELFELKSFVKNTLIIKWWVSSISNSESGTRMGKLEIITRKICKFFDVWQRKIESKKFMEKAKMTILKIHDF